MQRCDWPMPNKARAHDVITYAPAILNTQLISTIDIRAFLSTTRSLLVILLLLSPLWSPVAAWWGVIAQAMTGWGKKSQTDYLFTVFQLGGASMETKFPPKQKVSG